MFLTPDERRELTGRATKVGQKRWLRENGIPYKVRADGWPVVARAAVMCVLAPKAKGAQDEQPDLSDLLDPAAAA